MTQATWHATTEPVPGGTRYRLYGNDQPLSFRVMLGYLAANDDWCDWYTGLLAAAAPRAFFWEHPPVREATIERPAEFVLLDAPTLARERADPGPFRAHFAAAGDADVAVFANLGRDAILVAPCPRPAASCYAHLAVFLREAPPAQIRHLWRAVAGACRSPAVSQPFWLSTAGLGVPWLHLRIDQFPKYYQHVEYRR